MCKCIKSFATFPYVGSLVVDVEASSEVLCRMVVVLISSRSSGGICDGMKGAAEPYEPGGSTSGPPCGDLERCV